MATSTLLTLIDDIATILDDVATMSKVAVKKTAGVLGDDLALNAQQVTGIRVNRELPVVWKVAQGSLLNKVILVPMALAVSAFIPWAVVPLLMLGGLYLCFEGVEKLVHKFLPHGRSLEHEHQERLAVLSDPQADVLAFERGRVRGAVRTDFILSAEIIVISLGTVAGKPFATQLGVLVVISLVMTVGVYGLVAGIVKLDDLGQWLSVRQSRLQHLIGRSVLRLAPWLMRFLSIAGTAAMFLVGGGILVHGLHSIEEWIHHTVEPIAQLRPLGSLLSMLAIAIFNALVGVVAGGLALLAFTGASRLFNGSKEHHPSEPTQVGKPG